ncbi:MAG TPA: adenine deaminase [Bacteroidales bacterium]|nr:adenine deaminase [Bacteroidales bacterium]
MNTFIKQGWFADFEAGNFYQGRLTVESGIVKEIWEVEGSRSAWPAPSTENPLILPGLVDAHIHIESSMVLPSRFSQKAVEFGTVATVSDPHEIANVLGNEGIRFMAADAARGFPVVRFTAPSCVPATPLEESGAVLEAADLQVLFEEDLVVALGEVMNFPGVIGKDPGILAKLNLAVRYGMPVDGHAPGLSGTALQKYVDAGISTDHECFSIAEAREKIALGMKILIREGSAARNFEALWPLIDEFPDRVMLCTDDFHPDDLELGHMDRLIRRGLKKGLDFFNLYRAATFNPMEHYRLKTGRLRTGDPADFIIVKGLDDFTITATYLGGYPVFGDGALPVPLQGVTPINHFNTGKITPEDLLVRGSSGRYRVILAMDGELITQAESAELAEIQGFIYPDAKRDILKIAVVNRYRKAPVAIGFITGFGLKEGAMASSIAHDSHNIVAVGTDERTLAEAINLVIEHQGGISVWSSGSSECLPLPVAGLMSTLSVSETAEKYRCLTQRAKDLGSELKAPFMTLSFMSLLVIPHLKLGDRGLFDGDNFTFVPLRLE